MSFATIKVEKIGNESIDRINKILTGVPNGAIKAAYAALKRAGDTAKTKAGQFASAEYTISKADFMRNVTEKVKTEGGGGTGGVASMNITYAGHVIPLISFNSRFTRQGVLTTQVKRNGGAASLQHAFAERVFGPLAIFERTGTSRFPVEQKFGPSAAHMMQNEKVVEKMEETIRDTFDKRIEHEILRVLNGWGG